MDTSPSILIATCGNAMAAGDGFGPLVAQALHDLPINDSLPLKIVNLAMNPASLLDHLPGPDLLILVDAAQTDSARLGELIDVDWFSPDRPTLAHDATLSSHGVSIAEDIELARRLDVLPGEVRLVAVMIGPTTTGAAMPKEVRRQVPIAAKRIADYAHLWAKQYQ